MRLGVLTDVHWDSEPGMQASWHNPYDFGGLSTRFDEAGRIFTTAGVDAVCVLGDLTHRGAAPQLRETAALLRRLAMPVFAVSGNHDVGGSGPIADALAPGRLGTPAGVRIDGARLAGINVAVGSWFGARVEEPPDVPAWGDDSVVLLSHYPVLSHAERLSERGMPYPGDVVGRSELAAALHRRGAPSVVLSGHIHARDSLVEGAILQLTQAALIEPPYECAVVDISGAVVTREAHPLPGQPTERPIPALVPARERFAFRDGSWFRVA